MKFWLLIFVAFFANYFSLDKITECVKEKMRPSFDEIFGKGWDEEEKEQQKMDESQQNNGGGNGITNKNQMSDNDKTEEQNKVGDQKEKDQPTDQEKRTIIEKFHLVKEKLKEIGQFPRRKRTEIERQIGKQLLGVSLHKIHKWKREFGTKNKHYYEEKKREFIERMDEFKGMIREGKHKKIAEELGIGGRTLRNWKKEFGMTKAKRKYFPIKFYTDQQKRDAIKKFDLLRKKLKEIGKFPSRKRGKIERQIGKELGTNRDKIYKWKREFDQHRKSKCYSDQEKREIIQKFGLIKEKLKEIGQFPSRKRAKIEQQIGNQLGVYRGKIYKWKREMGTKNKHYYERKKREFIERMDEFKKMLKEGKQQKIVEELGIGGRTIRRWKRELGINRK